VIAPPAGDVLHKPLAALVSIYGAPSAAASRDDGQHIVFSGDGASVDAIVDDDATVHAVELTFPAGTPYAASVDGAQHRLVFGVTTSTGARDEMFASAETDGANFRTFRRDAGSDIVLRFDAQTQRLARVVVGDRATLLRLGYEPDPAPLQHRFPYAAPVLRKTAVPDGTGPQATVVRLDLDRTGAVTNAAVVVPSADASFDRALPARLAHDLYVPAKLAGRALGASVFREVRH
jgi:hypothetical protein